jgi:ubiquitin-conjugating enzyme E2 D/E
VAVIFFESELEVLSEFTTDFEYFKKVINQATPKGSTRLYDALSLAVDKLIERKIKYP